MTISETLESFRKTLEDTEPPKQNIVLAGRCVGEKLIKLGAKPLGLGYYDCTNLNL